METREPAEDAPTTSGGAFGACPVCLNAEQRRPLKAVALTWTQLTRYAAVQIPRYASNIPPVAEPLQNPFIDVMESSRAAATAEGGTSAGANVGLAGGSGGTARAPSGAPWGQPAPNRGAQTARVATVPMCRSCVGEWGTASLPDKKVKRESKVKAMQSWSRRRMVSAVAVSREAGTEGAGRAASRERACHACTCTTGEPVDRDTRIPTRPKALARLSTQCEAVRDRWAEIFAAGSDLSLGDARAVQENAFVLFLCSVHLNRARHAADAAVMESSEKSLIGAPGGLCMLHRAGCSRRSRHLRVLSLPQVEDETDDLETRLEVGEAVRGLSNGALSLADIEGRRVCSPCRGILLKVEVSDWSYRELLPDPKALSESERVVAYGVLDVVGLGELQRSGLVGATGEIAATFHAISASSIPVEASGTTDVVAGGVSEDGKPCFLTKLVPYSAVYRVYTDVHERWKARKSHCGVELPPAAHRQTLESRIVPTLAARGVHLYPVSAKMRCFASVAGMSAIARATALCVEGKLLQPGGHGAMPPRLSLAATRASLAVVGKRFAAKRLVWDSGNWTLSEEIEAIPAGLWRDIVLQMASDRRVTRWRVSARAQNVPLIDLFPLCNSEGVLKSMAFEEVLRSGTWPGGESEDDGCGRASVARGDCILALRAFKTIESFVLSRTNGVLGPLSSTATFASLLECSPSWYGVLNRLGFCGSYEAAVSRRDALIVAREAAAGGAFDSVEPSLLDFPTVQLDNWNSGPKHSFKMHGKRVPVINGSVTQGMVRKRRRFNEGAYVTEPGDEDRDDWGAVGSSQKSVDTTKMRPQTREEFAEKFLCDVGSESIVMSEFGDVVYGLCHTHRANLLNDPDDDDEPGAGQTQTRTRRRRPYSMRDMLLAAFQPHGGAKPTDDAVWHQRVIYVNVDFQDASSKVTIRSLVLLVLDLLQPGADGRPRYVVLVGDQPVFKMIVELREESERLWLESGGERVGVNKGPLPLYEWVVPVPGFFHIEKQALIPIAKELLDGLGLEQLVEDAGWSKANARDVLTRSHARDNRQLILNILAALTIRVTDLTLEECPEVADEVAALVTHSSSVDADDVGGARFFGPQTPIRDAASAIVTPTVLATGRALRRSVKRVFTSSNNGAYFLSVMESLLDVAGVHVLSRCGHTDLFELFWRRSYDVLFSSSHLHYQDLAVKWAVLRDRMPLSVVDALFNDKPGAAVARAPSFLSASITGLDDRGDNYMQLDELLESMIVRAVKGLGTRDFGALENSAAYLQEAGMARNRMRVLTGAGRAYGRFRGADDVGEDRDGAVRVLLRRAERNGGNAETVRRMCQRLGEAEFLGQAHRDMTVLCTPLWPGGLAAAVAAPAAAAPAAAASAAASPAAATPATAAAPVAAAAVAAAALPTEAAATAAAAEAATAAAPAAGVAAAAATTAVSAESTADTHQTTHAGAGGTIATAPPRNSSLCPDENHQQLLLRIRSRGRQTFAYHLSVSYPKLFGPLTEADRKRGFGGWKFARWTKRRAVPSLGSAVRKRAMRTAPGRTTRVTKTSLEKILAARRRSTEVFKDKLYDIERNAMKEGNMDIAHAAQERRDRIMSSRQVVSPYADAFRRCASSGGGKSSSLEEEFTHAAKAAAVPALDNVLPPDPLGSQAKPMVSSLWQGSGSDHVRDYFAVQLDVMNFVHHRGDDEGSGGRRLCDAIFTKMARTLRRWIHGGRASSVTQIHLHIDNPGEVIPQKTREQSLRDSARGLSGPDCDRTAASQLPIDFMDNLVGPWSTIISTREYKDQVASAHLFYGAQVVAKRNEAVASNGGLTLKPVDVFLHGGAFALEPSCIGAKLAHLMCTRWIPHGDDDGAASSGYVRIAPNPDISTASSSLQYHRTVVSRSTPLVVRSDGTLQLGNNGSGGQCPDATHGESETRIVQVMRDIVLPTATVARERDDTAWSRGCVIVSCDTDVFFIIAQAKEFRGLSAVHVLGERIIEVDAAHRRLSAAGIDTAALSAVYAFAGCDFLPGTNGVPHAAYFKALVQFTTDVGKLTPRSSLGDWETLTLLAYLSMKGSTKFVTEEEHRQLKSRLVSDVQNGVLSETSAASEVRRLFVVNSAVGTGEFRIAARQHVVDRAKSLANCPPPLQHLALQVARASLIANEYWGRASSRDISKAKVGGLGDEWGYRADGCPLLELVSVVKEMKRKMNSALGTCGCKGDCATGRCSCKRRSEICVGCDCSPEKCVNGGRMIAGEERPDAEEATATSTTAGATSGTLPDCSCDIVLLTDSDCDDSEDFDVLGDADPVGDSESLMHGESEGVIDVGAGDPGGDCDLDSDFSV